MAHSKKESVHRHHRLPRSRGGTNHPNNLSIVRAEDHVAYHKLFGNMLADEMASMLTDTWIDPDYYLVAVPRKRRVGKSRERLFCLDCNCEVLKELRTTKKDGNEK